MSRINIGKPIDTTLIRCCSCHKGYEIKGNLYDGNILICPHCGLKHRIDFKLFDKRIENLKRLNKLMKHEPELRNWMDAWSIGAVFEMNKAGEELFNYYRRLRDSSYNEKSELDLIK